MKDIVISKLEKEDIIDAAVLVKKVYNDMISKRTDIFISNDMNFEKYLEEKLKDIEYILLTAKLDENVVGACVAEIKHLGDNIETIKRDIMFIEYIVVDEKYQRNNIGSLLLDEMKQIAKDKKVQSLELNVWGYNNKAIKFYEKNEMTKKRIVYEYFLDKE